MSRWVDHVNTWKNCTACDLCEKRSRVVLARGSIPCDILFIGEAPGPSEDSLGKAFIGPAGKELDSLISMAIHMVGIEIKVAFTNLVACIPLVEGSTKFEEPPLPAIKACAARMYEFISIANPKAIILAGKLSAKHVMTSLPTAKIIHPAAIIRADKSQRGLLRQEVTVTIADMIRELHEG